MGDSWKEKIWAAGDDSNAIYNVLYTFEGWGKVDGKTYAVLKAKNADKYTEMIVQGNKKKNTHRNGWSHPY